MNLLRVSTVLAASLLLAACVSMPKGPSVMVLPGTGKSFDQFRYDDVECRQFADVQVGGTSPSDIAADSAAKSAAVGTVVGAAAGAALGGRSGAAAGAGGGPLICSGGRRGGGSRRRASDRLGCRRGRRRNFRVRTPAALRLRLHPMHVCKGPQGSRVRSPDLRTGRSQLRSAAGAEVR